VRIVLACSVVTLLVSATALAQTVSTPPASPPAAKKDDGSKLICKTEEFIGSKIPKRICMTRSEWEQGRQNAREIMDERQMWKPTKGVGGG
jgi:hypothetical protein